MNDTEERIETNSEIAQEPTANELTPQKIRASGKSRKVHKKRQAKRRNKTASAHSVLPRKRSAIRKQLTLGKTEAETSEVVGETLETVKREARIFWEELAGELLANPTTSRVQAVMRALNVYAGSQEAISALAKDQNAKPSDKVKYMELALDANKEIMRFQSMEKSATEKEGEVNKDARRAEERPTREQLGTAITLLNEHIGRLKREEAGSGENKTNT